MGKGGKMRTVKKNIADKDISRIFNEMLNADHANVNVAWPKYQQLIKNIDDFIKIFIVLRQSTVIKGEFKEDEQSDDLNSEEGSYSYYSDNESNNSGSYTDDENDSNANDGKKVTLTDLIMKRYESEYRLHGDEIDRFLEQSLPQLQLLRIGAFIELFQTNSFGVDLNGLTPAAVKDFRTKYKKLKESNLINAMQVICSKLLDYRADIEDITKLDANFIVNMAGVEFKPFPFTSLDYKDIFLDENIQEKTKKYLLLILNKIFLITLDTYNIVSSPDVDVDEFVNIIITNLDRLKAAPGLSQCDKAFRKIRQSAELLKSKFTTYYRDLEETNSPTIMMENFILDVANETDADPQTMMQFKKIINYYRKATASQRGKDPKMDMLFAKVDEHFKKYNEAAREEYGPDVKLEPDEDIDVDGTETTEQVAEKDDVADTDDIETETVEKNGSDDENVDDVDDAAEKVPKKSQNKNKTNKLKKKKKGKRGFK